MHCIYSILFLFKLKVCHSKAYFHVWHIDVNMLLQNLQQVQMNMMGVYVASFVQPPHLVKLQSEQPPLASILFM